MIAVINFGGQYIHLIARRVRELGIRSEIFPYNISADNLRKLNPEGIILSGGPSSVNEPKSPLLDKEILGLGIPVLGICYGHQLISKLSGGRVSNKNIKEYGKKIMKIKASGILFSGLDKKQQVWMSHGDSVVSLPKGFRPLSGTDTCKVAAFENNSRKLYGVQFHPEVVHTLKGMDILKNFLFRICRAKKDWVVGDMVNDLIKQIRSELGSSAVIMGVSGGVDSTVAATLLHKAIGNRLHCVFIDHGLVRKNEAREVKEVFRTSLKFKNFYFIDASRLFLKKLKGVTDPEKKRKIIGHLFVKVFEAHAIKIGKNHKDIDFLGQGTIYPDRIESAQPSKQADKIKSHHNIALPRGMKLKVIEPLKDFYKDEVRSLGRKLGIPSALIDRHPFPGPGLAIRILGEITDARLNILREADAIYIDELKKSGYYSRTWQAFAALLPVKTVGVMGDARTYEYIISLRAVTSIDAMTADWARLPDWLLEQISSRIINEVRGVNRVLYDVSQKPPATIEYE